MSTVEEVAGEAQVAATTKDGRLVYVYARASGKPAPGLNVRLEDSVRRAVAGCEYWELFSDELSRGVLEELRREGFEVSSVEIAVSYRCPRCGAPVELTPEAVIYVCKYCGWAGDVFGHRVEMLAWRPLPEEEILPVVLNAVGRGAKPSGAVLRVLPYWVFKVRAVANYRARVVYEVVRGKRRVRRAKDVEGVVRHELVYPVLARLNAEFYGDDEMSGNLVFNLKVRPPSALSEEDAKKLAPHVLAPELSAEEAARIARDRVEDVMLSKAKADARKGLTRVVNVSVYQFSCEVEVEDVKMVLVPYWFVTYEVGGCAYSAAVSGIDGDLLKAEAPLSARERVARLAAAWVVAALTGLAAEMALGAGSRGGETLILALVGAGVALALARSAFEEAKIVR